MIGSNFIGFFAAITATEGRLFVPASARMFVMVGLCGGFTTFSSFSLETLNLARDGQFVKATVNILATVISCLVGVWCGALLASILNER